MATNGKPYNQFKEAKNALRSFLGLRSFSEVGSEVGLACIKVNSEALSDPPVRSKSLLPKSVTGLITSGNKSWLIKIQFYEKITYPDGVFDVCYRFCFL